ncbi:MAG: PmoA family protein [Sedimentisphaerales bacterium]|jgi:hypothetical protein|nr:PmoA family protein [Planctomycetota bacterium]MDY0357534.1 PmoA family protein [Sedimentisphaerales bacterium]
MQTRRSSKTVVFSFLVFLCLLFGTQALAAEPLATFTVRAGEYTRVDTPVSAPLVGLIDMASLRLEEVKGSQRVAVPAQVEAGSTPRLWWILGGTTPAGQSRVFELVRGAPATEGLVKAVKGDKALDLQLGGANILRYNHAVVPAPKDIGRIPETRRSLYDRSGFIHPLWSTKGSVLTEIHPADHIHHMGLWMPWTHTQFEGRMVDFWNVGDGTGTVRFAKYLSTTDGPVFGGFQVEQEHVARKTSKGEQVILNEVWDVRAYNVGGPEKGYWLIDFESTQRCVADEPLIQDQYRYGGFGFRATSKWKGQTAAYLTSEGKGRDGHGTRARWCDTSGRIDEWEGVTFYSHPQNFQHPEPMRIWPELDNYIFFNFCPSQAEPWEMKPAEDHVFRYRMYVHQGKVVVADAERIWQDYANPPQVDAKFSRPDNAIVLFDGTDFSNWERDGGGEIRWKRADGAMQVVPGSGGLVTKKPVKDFVMHVEFQLPTDPQDRERGNSGVYIQRRYEVQIINSYGEELEFAGCGSIYRFKAPDYNVCKAPGEWQSYDIRFREARYDGDTKVADARVTVYHNGVLVHDDVAVPNKTGAGRPEGPEPLPILLQDHGSAVSFRNIWIAPLDSDGMSFRDNAGRSLDVLADGKPLLRYMYDFDSSTSQRRFETYKPFLHVYDGMQRLTNGPDGQSEYLADGIQFPHHRGVFVGWNKIGFEGKRYDLWHMPNVAQVHQRFEEKSAEGNVATFVSVVHWNDPDGEPVLVERRHITARRLDDPTVVLLDWRSDLTAVRGDVALDGDPEHAGVQYRAHNDVGTGPNEDRAQYLFHRDGIDPRTDKDLPWVTLSHGLAGRRYWVQQMNHPDNPKETVFSAYRDYGRFGAFFTGTIDKDRTLTLRYRFQIGRGPTPSRQELAARYAEYASPR